MKENEKEKHVREWNAFKRGLTFYVKNVMNMLRFGDYLKTVDIVLTTSTDPAFDSAIIYLEETVRLIMDKEKFHVVYQTSDLKSDRRRYNWSIFFRIRDKINEKIRFNIYIRKTGRNRVRISATPL